MCDIEDLKLGYKKCNDRENIKVTVCEINKKKEEIKMDICDKCWIKLSKNDKFYTHDQNAYIQGETVLEVGE